MLSKARSRKEEKVITFQEILLPDPTVPINETGTYQKFNVTTAISMATMPMIVLKTEEHQDPTSTIITTTSNLIIEEEEKSKSAFLHGSVGMPKTGRFHPKPAGLTSNRFLKTVLKTLVGEVCKDFGGAELL